MGEKRKAVKKTVTVGGIKKIKTHTWKIEEQVWVHVCIVRARIPPNFITKKVTPSMQHVMQT